MNILPQNTSGIYKIENTANGKCYVGSAANIGKRWGKHLYDLHNNKHCNRHLQNAWNKYGENSFSFSVVEICFPFMLISIEQHFIDKLSPEYNIAPMAGSTLGYKHSPETCAKIRAARAKQSPETFARPDRPVFQYTTSLRFVAEYQNVKAAQNATGANGIGNCANGKAFSAGGWVWRWKYRFPPHRDGIARVAG